MFLNLNKIDNYIVLILLILTKSLIFPLITRFIVFYMDIDANYNYETEFNTFSFLWGTFPTAPSIYFYLNKYNNVGESTLSTALVFGNFTSNEHSSSSLHIYMLWSSFFQSTKRYIFVDANNNLVDKFYQIWYEPSYKQQFNDKQQWHNLLWNHNMQYESNNCNCNNHVPSLAPLFLCDKFNSNKEVEQSIDWFWLVRANTQAHTLHYFQSVRLVSYWAHMVLCGKHKTVLSASYLFFAHNNFQISIFVLAIEYALGLHEVLICVWVSLCFACTVRIVARVRELIYNAHRQHVRSKFPIQFVFFRSVQSQLDSKSDIYFEFVNCSGCCCLLFALLLCQRDQWEK
jgi:hypothetical protein